MTQVTSRSSRLEARVAPDVLAAVKRAAEIEGRSISDFVVDAARRAAEHIIEEAQIIRLSLADQERVASVLLGEPKASAALYRAMARHRKMVQSSE